MLKDRTEQNERESAKGRHLLHLLEKLLQMNFSIIIASFNIPSKSKLPYSVFVTWMGCETPNINLSMIVRFNTALCYAHNIMLRENNQLNGNLNFAESKFQQSSNTECPLGTLDMVVGSIKIFHQDDLNKCFPNAGLRNLFPGSKSKFEIEIWGKETLRKWAVVIQNKQREDLQSNLSARVQTMPFCVGCSKSF